MSTKKTIIAKVAAARTVPMSEAERQIDAVVAAIRETIAQDKRCVVPGLGTFKLKLAPARDGRNPATGEVIRIQEREVIRFTESKPK